MISVILLLPPITGGGLPASKQGQYSQNQFKRQTDLMLITWGEVFLRIWGSRPRRWVFLFRVVVSVKGWCITRGAELVLTHAGLWEAREGTGWSRSVGLGRMALLSLLLLFTV